jgi:CubicO group peptidase (beta-lactamase class C family)
LGERECDGRFFEVCWPLWGAECCPVPGDQLDLTKQKNSNVITVNDIYGRGKYDMVKIVQNRVAIFGMALVSVFAVPGYAASQTASQNDRATGILAIASKAMADDHLRAVLLRVTIDGQDIVTAAMGESGNGVPATTAMHFRNGAVAISYIATILLELADKKVVTLDAPLSSWLPELPDSDAVTLRMLAMMTAGYPDYVRNPQFIAASNADPYRQWRPQELIDIGLSTPRIFQPGTNWDYSHTNYVILGRALERIADMPMERLMKELILSPLDLANTRSVATPAIQRPVLHAFSSERREALGIPASEPFYEDSTYWNPSWTLAKGAIQTTNIYDLAATAVAVGTGSLLSPESHTSQIAPSLLGFGHQQEGCPACHTLDAAFNYGIGVVMMGNWILQNPLFGGYGAVEAYLPSQNIAVAVAVTFDEQSFDAKGEYLHGQAATTIFREIASYLTGVPVPH